MNSSALSKLLGGITKEGKNGGSSMDNNESRGLPFHPLTVGLRIDRTVPSGTGRETTATQFIWVSPDGSSQTVRTLKVLLFPN